MPVLLNPRHLVERRVVPDFAVPVVSERGTHILVPEVALDLVERDTAAAPVFSEEPFARGGPRRPSDRLCAKHPVFSRSW